MSAKAGRFAVEPGRESIMLVLFAAVGGPRPIIFTLAEGDELVRKAQWALAQARGAPASDEAEDYSDVC